MKKATLCALICLILALPLSSCLNLPVFYSPEHGTEGIASVKIYYVEKGNGYDAWNSAPDLEEICTAVYTVDEDRRGELLEDVAALDFTDFILLFPIPMDPNFYVYGFVVAITYEDGAYEYITPNGIQLYGDEEDSFSLHHYNCDETEWENLIRKYAPELLETASESEQATSTDP